MAKSISLHVEDMTDMAVPLGTAMYYQVRDPAGAVAQSDRWLSFDADNAAWRIANPDQDDPTLVPFAATVDAESPTLGEKLFVQARFMVTSSAGGLSSQPATWMQINATNFPTLNVAALKTALKNVYDAQRLFEDLVPLP